MKLKTLFLLHCSEAIRFCDKAQYQEVGLLNKLKLQLHFIYCKACKKYHLSNGKLTDLIRKSDIQTCTKEEKENFRRKMAEASKISKDQQP